MLSVALTVIGKVPNCNGVPLSVPSLASVSPNGNVPLLRLNVVVPMPPVCVNCWLKAVPAVPVVVVGLVTVIVWHVLVKEKLTAAAAPLPLALTL